MTNAKPFVFDGGQISLADLSIDVEPFALRAGSINLIDGDADSRVSDFLQYLAGLQNRRGLTAPASEGSLVREEIHYEPEMLGKVKVFGESVYEMNNSERAKSVGVIFENPELFTVGRTVMEDFSYTFAAIAENRPEPQRLRRYGLFEKLHRPTHVLSGGEQHRLNCASVFEVGNPIIIADFSSSNLDPDFISSMVDWVGEQAESGTTFLIYGLPWEVFSEADLKLFATKTSVSAVESSGRKSLAGQQQELGDLLAPRSAGSSLLEVKKVGRADGITDAITLTISEGEVVQLLGSNGCGKTTLAKMIAGYKINHTGRLELNSNARVGMCLQFPERLFLKLTVKDEVKERSLLDMVGISGQELEVHPRLLSRSKQKLLGCLLAFIHSDRVVILDEPTTGMDFEAKKRFMALLNHFSRHGVLILNHDPALSAVGEKVQWEEIVV